MFNKYLQSNHNPAGRGSESSDKASERLIDVLSTRVVRVGYFLSFSISFILLVACFLLVHVKVPVVPAITCSLIFLSATGIAYQRFNLFKIDI